MGSPPWLSSRSGHHRRKHTKDAHAIPDDVYEQVARLFAPREIVALTLARSRHREA